MQKQAEERQALHQEELKRNVEESPIVVELRKEVNSLQKSNQRLSDDLSLTKHLLKEVQIKCAEKDLDNQELRREKRMLEQFVQIETKSQTEIVNDILNGKSTQYQNTDQYNFDEGNQSFSPYPQSQLNRLNSNINLDVDENIF